MILDENDNILYTEEEMKEVEAIHDEASRRHLEDYTSLQTELWDVREERDQLLTKNSQLKDIIRSIITII